MVATVATLDGRSITTPEEFHEAIAHVLGLPDDYGRNLDALWDCLTGWVDTPTTIVWKDYAVSREALGEFAARVVQLIRDAAEEVGGLELRLE
jgi:ribonuclease inhibitor